MANKVQQLTAWRMSRTTRVKLTGKSELKIRLSGWRLSRRYFFLSRLSLRSSGYTLDLGDLGNKLLSVVEALFMVLSILGIVVDPTTDGVGDSKQALTYTEPKNNY